MQRGLDKADAGWYTAHTIDFKTGTVVASVDVAYNDFDIGLTHPPLLASISI